MQKIGKAILIAICVLLLSASTAHFILAYHIQRMPIYIAVLTVIIVFILLFSFPVYKYYTRSLVAVDKDDSVSLLVIEEALDAVCIGAGIERPHLEVLDIPSPNALAFKRKGENIIGITKSLIEKNLSPGEAEAVMASEVSEFITDNAMDMKSFWSLTYVPAAFLVTVGVLSLMTFGLAYSLNENMAIRYFPWALLICFIIWPVTAGMFVLFDKRMKALYKQDAILNDSIAVQITKYPAALRDMIIRIDGLIIGSNWKKPYGEIDRQLFVPLDKSRSIRTSINDRLKNLKVIELGFDPWS